MSPKALKIALAVSVALNLFAVAGGATAGLMWANETRKVEDQRRPGRENNVRQIVDSLAPPVQDRVYEALRASALAARPDFEQARTARHAAIAATTATSGFDPAAVTALLETSRAAELRGRARLERDSVALLATLEPADRQALGVILSRHGKGGGMGRGPRDDSRGRMAREAQSPDRPLTDTSSMPSQ